MEEARLRSIRIPEDLSIVGFDDTYLASRSAPPLTTVAQPLVEMGRLERSAVEELGDVVAGRTPGRTSDDEIVLLSVGGMPVEDVAWATTVYRTAVEHGIGTPLNLWERPALA